MRRLSTRAVHVASPPPSRRMLLLAALALTLPGGVAAQDRTPPASARGGTQRSAALDSELRALLSGYETAPSRTALLALGPGLVEGLIAIDTDPDAAPYLRLRSLHSLGLLDGARATQYLETVLTEETEALRLRAAIRAYLPRHAARFVARWSHLAEHQDAVVREAVRLAMRDALASVEQSVPHAERARLARQLTAWEEAEQARTASRGPGAEHTPSSHAAPR